MGIILWSGRKGGSKGVTSLTFPTREQNRIALRSLIVARPEEARVPRLVGLGCTAERSPASRASRGPRAIRS